MSDVKIVPDTMDTNQVIAIFNDGEHVSFAKVVEVNVYDNFVMIRKANGDSSIIPFRSVKRLSIEGKQKINNKGDV